MNNNTNTATATTFSLADATNVDIRRVLGITDERAQQIINLISEGAKTDGFGSNIKGGVTNAVAGLPNEAERLYGFYAIGHGMGMNDDTDEAFDGGENPLGALLTGDNDEDPTSDNLNVDDDDAAGI